ncbi:MAG: aminotransferase class V-fold PLP-dependent enzyme, partial [Saprospiraceae bacterium]
MQKRDFIKRLSQLGLVTSSFPVGLERLSASVLHRSPTDLASDEDFWSQIRAGYRLKPDYINLENGYYCFMPQEILERHIQRLKEVNFQGSWYMRNHRINDNVEIRKKLAAVVGTSLDEIIITRNTTESLDTIIAGYDWKPGDEAVMALQDYGAMLDMFKLQGKRYGINNVRISIPLHPQHDDEIIELYKNAITSNTRLLMVPHMVNITGQIMPVRKIADMAHDRGIDVMVDGAHCVGHIQCNLPELHADYYASSLHKWLTSPLGAGILYVKKDKIEGLWQLYGDMGYASDDIRKLNHTGTHPVHTDLAISDA